MKNFKKVLSLLERRVLAKELEETIEEIYDQLEY